jgi:hypothetical protein
MQAIAGASRKGIRGLAGAGGEQSMSNRGNFVGAIGRKEFFDFREAFPRVFVGDEMVE